MTEPERITDKSESPFGNNPLAADVFGAGCTGSLGAVRPFKDIDGVVAAWKAMGQRSNGCVPAQQSSGPSAVSREPLPPIPQVEIDGPTDWFDTQAIEDGELGHIELHPLEIAYG